MQIPEPIILNLSKETWKKSEWLEKNDFTLVEIEEAEVKNISKEFFKSKFGITL